jgi:Arc/MetJ-type ribon-helix-helix transcriptional regulator
VRTSCVIAGTVRRTKKTTIYLPEELKESLRVLAAASGRSESDLIREAITQKVRAARRPRPHGRLFDPWLSERVDEELTGFPDR